MKLFILTTAWTNQVSYSEGTELYAYLDRPSAAARVRELWTDLGLDYGTEQDSNPDVIGEGYWLVPYEGHLVWGIAEVELAVSLPQRMLAAADTLEEVSKVCQALNTARSPWTAAQLRNEAPHVQADSTV